jgi:hypothetical protein
MNEALQRLVEQKGKTTGMKWFPKRKYTRRWHGSVNWEVTKPLDIVQSDDDEDYLELDDATRRTW